jgi:hypothetical protein
MDVTLSCGLCGFEVAAEKADSAEAEHLAQLYAAVHTEHTDKQIKEFVWANGRCPEAYTDDDHEDGEPAQ